MSITTLLPVSTLKVFLQTSICFIFFFKMRKMVKFFQNVVLVVSIFFLLIRLSIYNWLCCANIFAECSAFLMFEPLLSKIACKICMAYYNTTYLFLLCGNIFVADHTSYKLIMTLIIACKQNTTYRRKFWDCVSCHSKVLSRRENCAYVPVSYIKLGQSFIAFSCDNVKEIPNFSGSPGLREDQTRVPREICPPPPI